MPEYEQELRQRYPEIPWDRPVKIQIAGMEQLDLWVCRFCIAMQGLKAADIVAGVPPEFAFHSYVECLTHIDTAHSG